MNPDADNRPVQPLSMPHSQAVSPSDVGDEENALENGSMLAHAQNSDKSKPRFQSGRVLPVPGSIMSQSQAADLQHLIKPGSTAFDDDMSIEKEVVAKAMAVVHNTIGDPYLQAVEIGKVKAELLKRRYGKDIKMTEG